jgi:MFS family permease
MERNVRFIPIHQALASSFVWLPVFVLFTRARFDLDGAILLASLYYLFVVVLEVPSGWFSDRVGRVITLRLAAASWVIAQLCFLIGNGNFAAVLVGQACMAMGFASLSGTDVSFHYDTLETLGRAPTFERRQARVASVGFAATSVAVLVGGALGLIDLRVPFAVATLLAVAQFGVTLRLVEPAHVLADPLHHPEVRTWLSYWRDAPLAWLFAYGIALVTLEHVSFSLMQPWLTETLDRTADDLGATPLVSGLIYAVTAAMGAVAARASAPLSERFGPAVTLVGLGALSAVIVTSMAWSTSVIVLAVVVWRSVQGAAAPVVISAAAAPRLEREHRATFLSLNSLAGRLGYGLILLSLAGSTDDDLTAALTVLTVIAWSLVVVIAGAAKPLHAGDL